MGFYRSEQRAVLMGDFVIGQKVAIFRYNYSSGTVKTTTVERDTKLYWVADGRKFRKRDGVEPNSGGMWTHSTRLLSLDDERVIKAIREERRDRAYRDVCSAQNDLAREREDLSKVQALQEALSIYAQVLADQIGPT